MNCRSCGTQLPVETAYCPRCGAASFANVSGMEVSSNAPALAPSFPSEISAHQMATDYGSPSYGVPEQNPYPPFNPYETPPPPYAVMANPYEQQLPRGTPPHRSLRGLWIALSITAVILLLLIALGSFVYVTRPTPAKTLDTFCDALAHGDSQTAYQQLSSRFQNETSEPLFARFFSQVTSCTHSAPAQSGTNVTASLQTTYSSGRTEQDPIILIQDGSGSWKIDDDPNLSTPDRTLKAVCNALLQADYHTAYTHYSSNYQRQVTEQAYVNYFSTDRVTGCSRDPITVSDSSASVTAMLLWASGKKTTYQETLIQVSDNTWKIDHVDIL